jgi:hypothetical protein
MIKAIWQLVVVSKMKKITMLAFCLTCCSATFAMPTFWFGDSSGYKISWAPAEFKKITIWGSNLEPGTLNLVLGYDSYWPTNQTVTSPFGVTQPGIQNPPSGNYLYKQYRMNIPNYSQSSVMLGITSVLWPDRGYTQVFIDSSSTFSLDSGEVLYFGGANPEPLMQVPHQYTLDLVVTPEPMTLLLLGIGTLAFFRRRKS